MGTTVIKRTAVTPTLATKCTIAFWTKRGRLDTSQCFAGAPSAGSGYTQFRFFHSDDDRIRLEAQDGGGSGAIDYKTNARFSDTNAWYHVCISLDATQGTAADRVKLYVNGIQITSWATQTTWNNDDILSWQVSGQTQYIGTYSGSDDLYDGTFAQYCFVDGTAEPPTTFGSFENGVWKAKSSPSPSAWGDNGFYLKFAKGALLTDSSGNGNNFTLHSGTQLYNSDAPDNNFPTVSKHLGQQGVQYFAMDTDQLLYGNLYHDDHSGDRSICATMAVHKGKWYWENRYAQGVNTRNFGIVRADMIANNTHFYLGTSSSNGTENTMNYNPKSTVLKVVITDKNDSGTETAVTGDNNSGTNYVGHYLDLDNGKYAWSFNGTIINSGNSFSLPDWSDTPNRWQVYGALPAARIDGEQDCAWNFGQGYFQTSMLTGTENTDWYADAGGEGIFKHNPTATIDGSSQDFRAICTRNIKTYG